MRLFIEIVVNISLPIFLLMGIGFVVNKAFDLHVQTLSKLLFWVFTPAIIFDTIVNTELAASDILLIGAFAFVQWLIMIALGFGTFSLPGAQGDRATLAFAVAFFNSGNYGFPLMLLDFPENGISIISIELLVQATLMFTVGIVMLDPETTSISSGARRLIGVPAIWALLIGVVVRLTGVMVPEPLMVPIDRILDAYIGLALITLGMQLAQVELSGGLLAVSPALLLRLIVAPVLSVGLVLLFGIRREVAEPLLLASGLPTAVNTYVLSAEYDRQPELASLVVFWSTLFSGLTISVLLLLLRQL
ncbi:MAG: AEC family transporter [Anaerolineae bacterium]